MIGITLQVLMATLLHALLCLATEPCRCVSCSYLAVGLAIHRHVCLSCCMLLLVVLLAVWAYKNKTNDKTAPNLTNQPPLYLAR